jgi:quercetin dioxygenase-like cupin family protein
MLGCACGIDVVPPFIAQGSSAMVRLLELLPGDPGLAPHRHSGPVFEYMLEGEMLFEHEGQAPYPIEAGEAFWEPGGRRHPLYGREPACRQEEPIRRGHAVRSWS